MQTDKFAASKFLQPRISCMLQLVSRGRGGVDLFVLRHRSVASAHNGRHNQHGDRDAQAKRIPLNLERK